MIFDPASLQMVISSLISQVVVNPRSEVVVPSSYRAISPSSLNSREDSLQLVPNIDSKNDESGSCKVSTTDSPFLISTNDFPAKVLLVNDSIHSDGDTDDAEFFSSTVRDEPNR